MDVVALSMTNMVYMLWGQQCNLLNGRETNTSLHSKYILISNLLQCNYLNFQEDLPNPTPTLHTTPIIFIYVHQEYVD